MLLIIYIFCMTFLQSNVVVVNQQPNPAFVTTVHPPVRDHYLTLSITLTVLCAVFGNWHALLCTIPAVIFSTMVSINISYYFSIIVLSVSKLFQAGDAEKRGDHTTAATHAKISLGLNIASIVAFLVGMVVSVAIVSVIVVRARAFIDDESYYDSSCYSYQYEYYSC